MCRFARLVGLSVVIFLLLFDTGVYAQRVLVDEAKKLVVMISGELEGMTSIGAGIVIGAKNNRLYIATANHVVRRSSEQMENIKVEFWSLPGETFSATLLRPLNTPLDLAVLQVDLTQANIPVSTLPLHLFASEDALEDADAVFTVGYGGGRPWSTLVEQANVTRSAGGLLELQSTGISQGDSGGGLFTESGELVGMIIRDAPPLVVAIGIDTVLETLKAERYPVGVVETPTSQQADQAQPATAASTIPQAQNEATIVNGDLAVHVFARSAEVRPGQSILYRFVVTNTGNEAVEGAWLSFLLPPQTARFYSNQLNFGGACTGNENGLCEPNESVIWDLNSIPAGQDKIISFALPINTEVPKGSTIYGLIVVTSSGSDAATELVVPVADGE